MNPERYRLIKNIILEALESDDVEAVLHKQCGDDLVLRQEVEELLALDLGETFLAQSPIEISIPEGEPENLQGKIGKIRIGELLARGGMGDIYAGVNETLERPVAIKIIKSQLRISAARRSAFVNEAKILSSLQHPNICQVYDFFEDLDKDVLVLELIDGITLREALDQKNSPNNIEVLHQICSALVVAHERGIMHHDLKPENVMITKDHQVKVLDFGLARRENLRLAASYDLEVDHSTSNNSDIAGTPGYMSPEQARGEQAGTASDIWSLGVLAVELLTGKKLYPIDKLTGLSTIEIIELTRRAEVDIPANLPGSEIRLLRAMLDPQAENRPTAREVMNELEAIQNRPRRRIAMALAASVVLVAGLAGLKYTTDLQYEQAIAEEQRERADFARLDAENLVSFMLDDLNAGLQSVGRLDLLESVADQAMSYYGGLELEQMQDSQGNPAVAMTRIAEVLDIQGRKEDALALLDQASVALAALHEQAPNDELVTYRLGNVHMLTLNIHKISGNFELAQNHAERSIELGRQLTQGLAPGTSPTENPSSEERWRLLARSLYLSADTSMRAGQRSEAVKVLEEANLVASASLELEPGLHATVADIQFKRCDLYHDQDLHDLALEACLASMAMDEALHQANPEDYQLHSNFALSHVSLARVYLILGRLQEALTVVEAGEAHYRELVNWDDANFSTLNEMGLILNLKGRVLHKLGNNDASQIVFEEVYEKLEPLIEDREEVTYMNTVLPALLHLGYMEQAREVASTLYQRGFRRREFTDLCEEFQLAECLD
ncbi:MAG: hypothetical protein NPIRA05_03940 [Nitrospirales bacterium]|nr:MAG: hypothetical protein NPIRA05_03940 [Nitrospirales bacterium]